MEGSIFRLVQQRIGAVHLRIDHRSKRASDLAWYIGSRADWCNRQRSGRRTISLNSRQPVCDLALYEIRLHGIAVDGGQWKRRADQRELSAICNV